MGIDRTKIDGGKPGCVVVGCKQPWRHMVRGKGWLCYMHWHEDRGGYVGFSSLCKHYVAGVLKPDRRYRRKMFGQTGGWPEYRFRGFCKRYIRYFYKRDFR